MNKKNKKKLGRVKSTERKTGKERKGKVEVERVKGIKKENRIEKGVLGRRDKRK